jgi:hypothetical protein
MFHDYRHPSYSPDIGPCDFWLFGMLKGVLKDRELNPSEEIEEAIRKIWNELIFNEVQSLLQLDEPSCMGY